MKAPTKNAMARQISVTFQLFLISTISTPVWNFTSSQNQTYEFCQIGLKTVHFLH